LTCVLSITRCSTDVSVVEFHFIPLYEVSIVLLACRRTYHINFRLPQVSWITFWSYKSLLLIIHSKYKLFTTFIPRFHTLITILYSKFLYYVFLKTQNWIWRVGGRSRQLLSRDMGDYSAGRSRTAYTTGLNDYSPASYSLIDFRKVLQFPTMTKLFQHPTQQSLAEVERVQYEVY